MNKVHFSSKSSEYATPQAFFDKLNEEFRFTLDPCCTHENAKCEKHFTIEENGLVQDWSGETVFCNPPYGRELPLWIEKCARSAGGATVVMLIPARTDTRAFHRFIYGKAEIRFVAGRLKFGDAKQSAANACGSIRSAPSAAGRLRCERGENHESAHRIPAVCLAHRDRSQAV